MVKTPHLQPKPSSQIACNPYILRVNRVKRVLTMVHLTIRCFRGLLWLRVVEVASQAILSFNFLKGLTTLSLTGF